MLVFKSAYIGITSRHNGGKRRSRMDNEELLEAMLLCENLYNNGGTVLEGDNTFQIIGKCIEKQIPKKPILDILNVAQPLYCPVCESRVRIPQPYCVWCGQKLEWNCN